ncbi:hypothetical protein DFJ74DRAFT_422054 [Hyaloraphidium curvatum]|nr:hypothetical protein DFJ74DRAFT_422054 [Hyaloraphidium curvatum]
MARHRPDAAGAPWLRHARARRRPRPRPPRPRPAHPAPRGAPLQRVPPFPPRSAPRGGPVGLADRPPHRPLVALHRRRRALRARIQRRAVRDPAAGRRHFRRALLRAARVSDGRRAVCVAGDVQELCPGGGGQGRGRGPGGGFLRRALAGRPRAVVPARAVREARGARRGGNGPRTGRGSPRCVGLPARTAPGRGSPVPLRRPELRWQARPERPGALPGRGALPDGPPHRGPLPHRGEPPPGPRRRVLELGMGRCGSAGRAGQPGLCPVERGRALQHQRLAAATFTPDPAPRHVPRARQLPRRLRARHLLRGPPAAAPRRRALRQAPPPARIHLGAPRLPRSLGSHLPRRHRRRRRRSPGPLPRRGLLHPRLRRRHLRLPALRHRDGPRPRRPLQRADRRHRGAVPRGAGRDPGQARARAVPPFRPGPRGAARGVGDARQAAGLVPRGSGVQGEVPGVRGGLRGAADVPRDRVHAGDRAVVRAARIRVLHAGIRVPDEVTGAPAARNFLGRGIGPTMGLLRAHRARGSTGQANREGAGDATGDASWVCGGREKAVPPRQSKRRSWCSTAKGAKDGSCRPGITAL